MRNDFYTYAYLREDGTPYYIGKGCGRRAFCSQRRKVKCPPEERILFLKQGLTEEEAFRHEVYMIAVLGRKDIGTGILRNMSEGGAGGGGMRGRTHSNETKEKIRQANTGKKLSEEAKEKLRRKKLSDEHKEKLRQANLGRKISDETRERLRQSHLGKKKVKVR